MPEKDEKRRSGDRRMFTRRTLAFCAFNEAIAGYCKVLDRRVTRQGCMTIRNNPEFQCGDCQGVSTERRQDKRRSGGDRRKGS
ncbi:MAG: hypothetical protein FWH34_01675 [Desulfovibrionaceae bacterium]|nr:hypothetical protein [Desulfovibrionaceae bacterium]